jgi:3-oxoacyl-ACP reductase-like protein
MSIFGKIKDAIFGDDGPHPLGTAAAQPAPAAAAPRPQAAPTATTPAAAPQAAPTKQVDPEAALEKIAASKGNPDLNWRTSIVDLMKLIGMDPSLANRKELATELGYTGEKNGSAEMNLWLHEKVMAKIRNG